MRGDAAEAAEAAAAGKECSAGSIDTRVRRPLPWAWQDAIDRLPAELPVSYRHRCTYLSVR
jgi:hypothetical protein